MKQWSILLLFMAVAGGLLFTGLGNNVFWNDEAETAFLGRAVLANGLPVAWNGTNLYGYHDGELLNDDLIVTVIPWLQYYVVALSFALFGVSTFAGRFPFALLGVFSVAVLYLFSKRYTADNRTASLSALLLVLSPSFLLFSRQCRYYSLTIFSALLCLWAWTSIQGKGWREILRLALAFTLFFYSNYVAFFSFAGALVFASLFTLNKWRRWRPIFLAFGLTVIFTGPWFLYARPHETYALGPLWAKIRSDIVILWWYFRELNGNSFFPVIYLFLLPLILLRRRPATAAPSGQGIALKTSNIFLILLAFFSILFLVLLTSQPQEITGVANIRFAAFLIPVFCLIMGIIINSVWKWCRVAAVVLLAGTLFTNLGTFRRFRSYLLEYVCEITHDYTTPYEAVLLFLQENASNDDTVLVRPEYCTYPLMFYQGGRLKFCGILQEDNPLVTQERPKAIPPYVYESRISPDWIVKFSDIPRDWLRSMDSRLWWIEMIPEPILNYLKSSGARYSRVKLDVFARDGTRPELMHHYFRPPVSFPPYMNTYIYKKLPGADKPDTPHIPATN